MSKRGFFEQWRKIKKPLNFYCLAAFLWCNMTRLVESEANVIAKRANLFATVKR